MGAAVVRAQPPSRIVAAAWQAWAARVQPEPGILEQNRANIQERERADIQRRHRLEARRELVIGVTLTFWMQERQHSVVEIIFVLWRRSGKLQKVSRLADGRVAEENAEEEHLWIL